MVLFIRGPSYYTFPDTLGRFGGMVAPWVEVLGRQYSPLIPPVVFGVTALVAGALALLLPETRGQALPYTIEQVRLTEMMILSLT